MRAPIHPLQKERLEALRRFEILDTANEESFDEIISVVAEVCETPIALISFVDEDRQWFKAEIGLGLKETGLQDSICSHVLLSAELVEIPDTLEDARTHDNGFCIKDPNLRFYAGAPLITSDGLPIGSLCVMDHKPRQLTPMQKRVMTLLARKVIRILEMRLALRTQEILRNEMDHRVKNSLQTVSSLIRLYKSRAPEGSAQAFEAIGRRVDAIALLHQELHQASEAEKIPLERFMPRVIQLLQNSAPANVKINFDVDAIDVGSAKASNIAVVVSEFVANSIKHAFGDGAEGQIFISLQATEKDEIHLHCEDNGDGTAIISTKDDAVSGLGQRLLQASAAQLGGELESGPTKDGYRLNVSFPRLG